jgi:hypothetical protein
MLGWVPALAMVEGVYVARSDLVQYEAAPRLPGHVEQRRPYQHVRLNLKMMTVVEAPRDILSH